MALNLQTTETFPFASDIPARAPLPNDALGLIDFQSGLHMTQAAHAIGNAANLVLARDASIPSSGWFYGQSGIEQAAINRWDRIAYDASGAPLGLLIEGDATQRVTRAQRNDLSQGVLTGATILGETPAPANTWQRWWTVSPTGAGEASLQLGTASFTLSYILVSFEVKAGTGRYVQIGSRAGNADAWANFDLSSGRVTATGAGVTAAAKRRPGGGWTVYAIVRKATSSIPDVQPYAASIATPDTGKLGASGGSFLLRAPMVRGSDSSNLIPGSPWQHETVDSRNADNLQPLTSLLAPTADFTAAFRLRSGWAPNQLNAGMFHFVAGSSAIALRFRADNTLAVTTQSESTVLLQMTARWAPDTIYRVGVSRTGQQLAVCVNGESGTITSATFDSVTSWRLGRHADTATGAWGGHLQKFVLWAGGRSQADLAAMVDRWV